MKKINFSEEDGLSKPIQLHTFGCKVNTYDTGLLEKKLKGLTSKNTHIINTCAVTRESSLSALRLVQKIKKNNKNSKVIITGCAAQIDTEIFKNSSADMIVANSHKKDMRDILETYFIKPTSQQQVFKSNIFKLEDLGDGGGQESHHTRSFLKIQDGCNSFCTFCIIPFARGKSRSLSPQVIVEKILELESQNVKEVVLTGIHIADYKHESMRMDDLVEYILECTSVSRLRLSSLEPQELSTRLLDLCVKNKRLCPHFHMSIQSTDDFILKSMKRTYTRKDIMECLNKIHSKLPHAFVGMDIIAGFPGETEDHFMNTYETLKKTPWTRIHAFPYSPRPGTYSLRLPNHNLRHIIKARSKKLHHLGQERLIQSLKKQVGKEFEVLVLNKQSKENPDMKEALSRNFWKFLVPKKFITGTQIQLKAKGTNGLALCT